MRTPCGVEKEPRLLSFAPVSWIRTAVRDHPVRTPSGVGKVPRLLGLLCCVVLCCGVLYCAVLCCAERSHAVLC